MSRKPTFFFRRGMNGAGVKLLKNLLCSGCSMQNDVQLTIVGKVFRPNERKVLALNKCLSEYFRLAKWHLHFNSTSKTFLHSNGYEEARRKFRLNTALIQTARDKAVETLKSFEENGGESSVLKLKRVSLRFDKRCYSFSKTTNILTSYWLTLSMNGKERVSLPIIFGEKQKSRIEEAFAGEWKFSTVDMVKREGVWYAHFTLKRVVAFEDNPQTVVGIDIGEVNLVTAIALADKPCKGQFWRGSEVKRLRGLYNHIRRRLGEKKLLKKIKKLSWKEKRKVNQQQTGSFNALS